MEAINWRRFLAFTPVSVVLAFLTAYRRQIAPQLGNLFFPLSGILFITFFILIYGVPRRKSTLTPMTRRGYLWLSVALIGIAWLTQTNWFVQLPTWILLAFCLAVFTITVLWSRSRRR
jgi:hypothetical protein